MLINVPMNMSHAEQKKNSERKEIGLTQTEERHKPKRRKKNGWTKT